MGESAICDGLSSNTFNPERLSEHESDNSEGRLMRCNSPGPRHFTSMEENSAYDIGFAGMDDGRRVSAQYE